MKKLNQSNSMGMAKLVLCLLLLCAAHLQVTANCYAAIDAVETQFSNVTDSAITIITGPVAIFCGALLGMVAIVRCLANQWSAALGWGTAALLLANIKLWIGMFGV